MKKKLLLTLCGGLLFSAAMVFGYSSYRYSNTDASILENIEAISKGEIEVGLPTYCLKGNTCTGDGFELAGWANMYK